MTMKQRWRIVNHRPCLECKKPVGFKHYLGFCSKECDDKFWNEVFEMADRSLHEREPNRVNRITHA